VRRERGYATDLDEARPSRQRLRDRNVRADFSLSDILLSNSNVLGLLDPAARQLLRL
jgi:hypothetical protein